MFKWMIGVFVALVALGWFVLAGVISVAVELVEFVAFGAFILAAVVLAAGAYLYSQAKNRLGRH